MTTIGTLSLWISLGREVHQMLDIIGKKKKFLYIQHK